MSRSQQYSPGMDLSEHHVQYWSVKNTCSVTSKLSMYLEVVTCYINTHFTQVFFNYAANLIKQHRASCKIFICIHKPPIIVHTWLTHLRVSWNYTEGLLIKNMNNSYKNIWITVTIIYLDGAMLRTTPNFCHHCASIYLNKSPAFLFPFLYYTPWCLND